MEAAGGVVGRMEAKCQPISRIWLDTEQGHFCCYSREQFMIYTFALIEDGFRFM